MVRGRYAPSPTGRMHLGNARTALLAWLHVRAAGGAFVLRIEDLDGGRAREGFERFILEDLRWLGLDWDEGPDVGGPHGPYRQSENAARYAAACDRLATYRCMCSRREIREATLAPHGVEPIYPGTCRPGTCRPGTCRPGTCRPGNGWQETPPPPKVAPRRPAARRWIVPPGVVRVVDEVVGEVAQDVAAQVGDFVLQRSDGAWAYQLAVVVDDAAMGITHVLRGVDLLDSTPRQVLLQRALGLPTPRYAHVPLLQGPDHEKLSKRQQAPDLGALREGAVDPQRVVAALARSVGLVGPSVMRVQPAELVADFELGALHRPSSPWTETFSP